MYVYKHNIVCLAKYEKLLLIEIDSSSDWD